MGDERRRGRGGRGLRVAVPTVAVLGAGSAIAAGAIPSDDGTLTGCYAQSNGALRLIDGGECRKHELLVRWNQQGPKGDPGPVGPQGPEGAQGPQGPAGPSGANAIMRGGAPLDDGRARIRLYSEDLNTGEDGVPLASFQVAANAEGAGGGSRRGIVSFSSFEFDKVTDASSPALADALVDGTHVKAAVVKFFSPDVDGKEPTVEYKFHDLQVETFKQGGVAEPPLLERVAVAFSKAELVVHKDGKTIRSTWDTKAPE